MKKKFSLINYFKGNKHAQNNVISYTILAALFIFVQVGISTGSMSSLMQGLLVPLCAYVILAVSLNLTVGILGELSLGHAGFMCVGAFAAAFFSKMTVGTMPDLLRFILALLVGMIVAGIFGVLIGIPVLRLEGDYLAIVTLAFGEIVKNIINVLYVGRDSHGVHIAIKEASRMHLEPDGETIISGALGISGTPKDSNYIIGFILVLITLIVVLNLVNSRDGRAVMSIRDNRIAAEATGINITKYKLLAFSISAAFAGMAGGLYAHNLFKLTATPKNFGYNMSIMILVFVVLGGIGNIWGSMIAAIILTLLPELLRGLNDYRMLIYSIVLIGMMLLNWSPQGILMKAKISQLFKSFRRRKNA